VAGGITIDRWECSLLRRHRESWLLLYGRRKTGKTWLLRNCVEWDVYAHVTRASQCILDSHGRAGLVELKECFETLGKTLRRGGVVVLDEFQRLPDEYLDLVAFAHGDAEGRLYACGSSYGLVHRVFEPRSPLLGIFQALHVDIASTWDTIASLAHAGLDPEDAAIWAPLARDPWILAHVRPEGDPWRVLAAKAHTLAPTARGLIGEVFSEEGRSLTRTYEAVLELLAQGVWRASDIAHHLYTRRLASTPTPGTATGILAVLEKMGLVKSVPLWKTRGARRYYRHRSTLTSLLYRLSATVEAGLTPDPETIRSWYGTEAQFDIGELLADYHGLTQAHTILPTGEDIDAVLLDKKGRPQWGYEIKLGAITRAEAAKAIERMRRLGIPAAGLISMTRRPPRLGDKQLGPHDLLALSRELAANTRRKHII